MPFTVVTGSINKIEFRRHMAKIIRAEKVTALKRYHAAYQAIAEQWRARSYCHPPPQFPAFPDICRGLQCEAKTRAGTPCKNDGLSYANGRCKFHGGASTGPVTVEGKRRVSQNAQKQTP